MPCVMAKLIILSGARSGRVFPRRPVHRHQQRRCTQHPMHYTLRTEPCLTGCPAPDTSGHIYLDWIYLDWIAIWAKE